MNSKTIVPAPVPKATLPSPVRDPSKVPNGFPPSQELGECLSRLHEEQQAIDRAAVERLAQLRAIQDRD